MEGRKYFYFYLYFMREEMQATIPLNLKGQNTEDPNLSQTLHIYWNHYP